METLDVRELEIKNFLSVKHFKAKMTPLLVFYGQNGSGKSIIAKLIYSLQRQYNYNRPTEEKQRYMFSRRTVDHHSESLLKWINIQRIKDEEASEIPLGLEYIISYFEDLLKQQFVEIPQYFNAGSWKTLLKKTRRKECTFSSSTSIFRCTVNITTEEKDVLIKPKLATKSGVALRIMKTNYRRPEVIAQGGEKAIHLIMSTIWEDAIFQNKRYKCIVSA